MGGAERLTDGFPLSVSARLRLGLLAWIWLVCRCRALRPSFLSLPSLSLSVHTPLLCFFSISVCTLRFYSLPSPLTEVGTLPRAGASKQVQPLSPLPPSFSPSLPSLALPVCTPLCWIFFPSSPPFSFAPCLSVAAAQEAAVCTSASPLLQVKTAASLDAANSKRGRGLAGWLIREVRASVVASLHSRAGCTFLIISKKIFKKLPGLKDGQRSSAARPTGGLKSVQAIRN